MARPEQPDFITHKTERLELISSLPADIPFDPFLYALFWYGEITPLRKVVQDTLESAIWTSRQSARDFIFCWMKRMGTSRSCEPSRASTRSSSPAPELQPFSAGPSVPEPSAETHTPQRLPAGSYSAIKRSSSAVANAKYRDRERCIITHVGYPDVVHIFPFCLVDRHKEITKFFLKHLLLFFPDNLKTWSEAIWRGGGEYVDSCENLMCLSPNAHMFLSKGCFGLEPLTKSPDERELTMRVHWFNQEGYSCNRSFSTVPELFKSASGTKLEGGPNGSAMADHSSSQDGQVRLVKSGDHVTMRTADPYSFPLPDMHILHMQFRMQLLVAASGAAAESTVQSTPVDLDGPSDSCDLYISDPVEEFGREHGLIDDY